MSLLATIFENFSLSACISAIFLIFITKQLYHAFFGGLSHIPGPFSAKFSSLWIILQCRFARRSESILQEHKKYGKVIRIAPNHISIADRSALDVIYGHKSGFLKGPFYEDRDSQVHQRKKRYLSPAFSAKNLNEYEPHMTEQVEKLIQCIGRQLDRSETVKLDFNEYSNYLAFDVIGDYAFGKSFGFLDKERDHLNLITTIDARGEVLNALGHIPKLLRPPIKYFALDPFWPKGLKATSSLASIGSDAYHERRAQEATRQDLLSFLFKAKDPDTGLPLAENEIIAESISFIVGGSDTTSTTMTNVVDILSRSPEVQTQLQTELDIAFDGPKGYDWVADYHTVNRLPVLNAVLRETMRFKPTSSTGLERVTPSGGRVISDVHIPEGTLVSVPTLNIHHDSAIFSNPDVFDISRWLNKDSARLFDSFYPFSLGPRACIGRNFAWMEMLKTLATLFKLFNVERVNPLSTNVREGFFVKNAECKVRISRR